MPAISRTTASISFLSYICRSCSLACLGFMFSIIAMFCSMPDCCSPPLSFASSASKAARVCLNCASSSACLRWSNRSWSMPWARACSRSSRSRSFCGPGFDDLLQRRLFGRDAFCSAFGLVAHRDEVVSLGDGDHLLDFLAVDFPLGPDVGEHDRLGDQGAQRQDHEQRADGADEASDHGVSSRPTLLDGHFIEPFDFSPAFFLAMALGLLFSQVFEDADLAVGVDQRFAAAARSRRPRPRADGPTAAGAIAGAIRIAGSGSGGRRRPRRAPRPRGCRANKADPLALQVLVLLAQDVVRVVRLGEFGPALIAVVLAQPQQRR